MQLERLKKIREQEEIELKKKEEAFRGREVIVDQIKSREIERLKLKEEQEREAQVLVQRMKEMERQEKLKIEVKSDINLEKEIRAAESKRGDFESKQECHSGDSTEKRQVKRRGRENCSLHQIEGREGSRISSRAETYQRLEGKINTKTKITSVKSIRQTSVVGCTQSQKSGRSE